MMVVARSFTLPAGTLPGDRSAGTKFDVSSSLKEEEEPVLPPVCIHIIVNFFEYG